MTQFFFQMGMQDTNERVALCMCFNYESHPPGKVVIKQNTRFGKMNFYYILSGKVE